MHPKTIFRLRFEKLNHNWCWHNVPKLNQHMHSLQFTKDPNLRVELYPLEDWTWTFRIVKTTMAYKENIVLYQGFPLGKLINKDRINYYKRQAMYYSMFWYYGFTDDDLSKWWEEKEIQDYIDCHTVKK